MEEIYTLDSMERIMNQQYGQDAYRLTYKYYNGQLELTHQIIVSNSSWFEVIQKGSWEEIKNNYGII
jgi:hypothetical protein